MNSKHFQFIANNLKSTLLEKASFRINRPLNKPSEVRLSITTRCNARCIMCNEWRSQKNEDIDLDAAKKIILRLKQWLGVYFLNLLGGEPLVHKHFLEIARFASNHGAETGIITKRHSTQS
jgi:MoaA/NifB/PqqE/SkfB family radical SAM enzyme